MRFWICVIKTVDITHQNQKICVTKSGYDGGQCVIIAQNLVVSGFNLGRRNGVIFVDNRDDAHLQQCGESAAQMHGTILFLHIVAGQKDLINGKGLTVELCGVCTDICVVSNAMLIKAALPEADLIVNSALCAGVTPAKHEAALETMRSCQITVR